MTAILWDGETMAADKQGVGAGGIKTRITKIRRIETQDDILLVGYSGPTSVAEDFFRWAQEGFLSGECPSKHYESDKGGQAMVIRRSDKLIRVYDQSTTPFVVESQSHAIGSSAISGQVGLQLGHTAAEVVEAINQMDIFCGAGVDVISF